MLTEGKTNDNVDVEARNKHLEKHKEVLGSVLAVFEDTEKIDDIMNDYDKENEDINQYRENRKERILKVLEVAGVDPEDYVTALKESYFG